jgi:hypothetical protein
MLEQLFGSKTRVKLLRLFLANQERCYFVRELTRIIDAQINAVRNELDNLVSMGVVKEVSEEDRNKQAGKKSNARSAQQRKYYSIDMESILYPELRALFSKSGVLMEKQLVHRLHKAGKVYYLALMGYFLGESDAPIDLFIVGSLNKQKLIGSISAFEKSIGREINYTIMTAGEYSYRRDLTDKFLYSILDSNKVTVIDCLSDITTEDKKELVEKTKQKIT